MLLTVDADRLFLAENSSWSAAAVRYRGGKLRRSEALDESNCARWAFWQGKRSSPQHDFVRFTMPHSAPLEKLVLYNAIRQIWLFMQVYATARALFVCPRTQKLIEEGMKYAYNSLFR